MSAQMISVPSFVIWASAATYSINSMSYADDMVLLAPSADALQDLINMHQVYAGKHDIVCNTTNTLCMVVPLRSKVNYLESAQLSEHALTSVGWFTYLGHVLHCDMTNDD